MLKFKLMMLFAMSLCLIGCDQVRDKVVNGFSWSDSKVEPVNNTQMIGGSDDLQPKNDDKVDQTPNKPSYTPQQTTNKINPPTVVKINPANKPDKPSYKPEQTTNSSNPPVVELNPVNKPDKMTPQNRSKDIGGFRDSDW
jgi:hypothetical protein